MPNTFAQSQTRRKRGNHSRKLTAANPKRGPSGFLLTCETGREVKCQREGTDLLLHYYNPAKIENSDVSHDESITLSLEEEISMLKKNKYGVNSDEENPFILYETGCRGTVFLMHKKKTCLDSEKEEISDKHLNKDETLIKSVSSKRQKNDVEVSTDSLLTSKKDNIEGCESKLNDKIDASSSRETSEPDKSIDKNCWNPVPLTERLFNDLLSNSASSPSSRFVVKVIPIQITCLTEIEAIKTAAKTCLKMYLLNNGTPNNKDENDSTAAGSMITTFEIKFHKRNCSHLRRDDVIKSIAGLLDENLFKVDLKNPEVTIWIEICRTLCGLSILRDVKKWKKFNLFTIRSKDED